MLLIGSIVKQPKDETQVKDKPYKIALRVIFLVFLFALLITSYVFCFSSKMYPQFMSYKLDGVLTTNDYYGAKPLELIVISPYENPYLAEEGDIVCYSTNVERGSGKLLMVEQNMFVLEKENGETARFNSHSIVGKQVNRIWGLGLVFDIFFSYLGVIIISILTLAYCAYLTFRRINFENTADGKFLLSQYRKEKRELRQRKQLFESLRKLDDPDFFALNILDGDYEHNLGCLRTFNFAVGGSEKEKFKFILDKTYSKYISHEKFSKHEEEIITNLFELMCEAGEFDLDMEYKLCDLAMRVKMTKFDNESFRDSVYRFLKTPLKDEDLLNFVCILYVMVQKNPSLRNGDFKLIAEEIIKTAPKVSEETGKIATEYMKSVINLIKT